MSLFEPSTLLAVFPYISIYAFPIFGIVLVTWWIVKDKRKSSSLLSTKNTEKKTEGNNDKNKRFIDH